MPTIFRSGLLEGEVAIVTGGGSGIGLAIAEILAELGAQVSICGRDIQRLETAKHQLRARDMHVHASVCDIRDVDAVEEYVKSVVEIFGTITVLINNAGGQFPSRAEELSPKGWEAVVRNNLNGTFFMTRTVAVRCMIGQRKGSIVNILANIARGFPGMVHTGAARAGVDNMTKTLAIEWAQHRIRVNAVAPGTIKSSGTEQYPPELVELSRRAIPKKRLGTPHEVGQLVAYLASEAADFVTGETWYIDGGAHLWGDTWTIPDPPEDN